MEIGRTVANKQKTKNKENHQLVSPSVNKKIRVWRHVPDSSVHSRQKVRGLQSRPVWTRKARLLPKK
jgi:hypothetical protein